MQWLIEHATLRLATVTAIGVKCEASSPELAQLISAAEHAVRTDPSVFPENVRAAIRNVLRVGGYKPTGRGKPASEFLLGAAREQGLPRVNNLVDINNVVSLKTALPISIFDRAQLGDDVSVRFGQPAESYVFNSAGQTMDVSGLPVVCSAEKAVGNAVKDSMHTKVGSTTHDVLAVIYGSRELPIGYLEDAAEQLRDTLTRYADAAETRVHFLPD